MRSRVDWFFNSLIAAVVGGPWTRVAGIEPVPVDHLVEIAAGTSPAR